MNLLGLVIASLAVMSRAASAPDTIIVMCGNNSDAITRAKAIVEAAGGKTIYDYNATGCVL